MGFIVIYITNKDEDAALEVARHLLDKKLIACANTFGVSSMYPWKGDIANEGEIVLLVKTRTSMWNAVRKEIESIHPYECPCIMKINVEANSTYENWIRDQVEKN